MSLIWIFIGLGGFIGSLVPMIFGASYTSLIGIVTGTIGSIIGIWLYKRLDLD